MKKRVDITKSVMERIVRFEERRSKRWLTIFWGIAILVTIFLGGSLLQAYIILSERRTWDLLEIFYQDREIITEFWQDTLLMFWAELPQNTLLWGSGFALFLVGYWIFTRHQRQIMKRRLAELAKRKNSSNNS